MKSTHALTVRKLGRCASERPPDPVPAHLAIRGPAAEKRILSMYDALCRSAMNRDAHEILDAVVKAVVLIERFQEEHGSGTLDQELRAAGVLGKRERAPESIAEQAGHWLEDTKGLIWTLDTFRAIFSAGLYPLDREPTAPAGLHADADHEPVRKSR